MKYRFPITITDVFERQTKKYVSGYGEQSIFETGSAGWYIQVNHTFSLFMGTERPKFEKGEKAFLQIVRQ